MSTGTSPARTSPVAGYLSRLRRRAAVLHAVRALALALGASSAVIGIGALLVGPLSAPAFAWGVWAAVALAVAAVLGLALRRFAPLSGPGAARLLRGFRDELASAARSAYELSAEPPPHASEAMIRAHEARVYAKLAATPVSRVVPTRWLRQREIGVALVLVAASGIGLATERGRAGTYALLHPGERDARGERVAVAFGEVDAHLVYPSYLGRPSMTVRDPSVLELPLGTSVEIRARARIEARNASLRLEERSIPLSRDESGRFTGRFVVREGGALALRLQHDDGDWVRDAVERRVIVLQDDAPLVTLVEPGADLVLDEPDEVAIRWAAEDDVGVASAELVFQVANGPESRRRIATLHDGERERTAGGVTRLDLALLGVERGQSVSVFVEARDGDVVSGPNVGRSRTITVTLASEATQRDRRLASLEELLDRTVHLLGHRLEEPEPEDEAAARDRFDRLSSATSAMIDSLDTVVDDLRSVPGTSASDVTLYTQMKSRVRRLLHEERMLHRPHRMGAFDGREDVDRRTVTELENDTLSLDDLLNHARIEDAAAIAHELEALRREIRSLLSEIRRTDSPEAGQRLLQALSEARARMQELAQRIAEMQTNVPHEFVNFPDLDPQETQSALTRLNEAVQNGDLEEAERLINDLETQINQLAAALGQSEESFGEMAFGPRQRAFQNAMESLRALEDEQQQLATRGTERRSRAARRALESIGGRDNQLGRQLADDARGARDALSELDRDRLASFEQDTYDRARQRLIDAEDALRAGDLGEARDMTQAASADLESLSRDLDLSALMFPGHEGETSDDARVAREVSGSVRELRRQLDEGLPDVASHLEGTDRQAMRGADLERQRTAREATERLEEAFEEGPDGEPLEQNAGRELRDAMRAMERAGDALRETDPLESARQQEDAAHRLTELRQRLEQEQNGGGGGGGEGSRDDFTRPVDIPDADQFEGPMELRRRLLDAMRAESPRGYEDAVRSYYEGLLR